MLGRNKGVISILAVGTIGLALSGVIPVRAQDRSKAERNCSTNTKV